MAILAIVVRFSFEGIHSWPGAPQDLPEAYLAQPHRHMFYVHAVKNVLHEERQIEIIALRREMLEFCIDVFGGGESAGGPHFMSCETMARRLFEKFNLAVCRVLEDDENGALILQDEGQ